MKHLVLFLALSVTDCIIEDNTGDDVPAPFCGDGSVNLSSEQCDDGNNLSGDGCSATCTTEVPQNQAHISATWQLRNEATNSATACPTGYDTAALYSQPVNASGQPAGSVIVDLFDCAASAGTSAALPASMYQVWIEIADHNNTMVYAKSLSAIVDVTTSDKTFNAQILNDGGYFQLAWTLRGATSNNALTCAQAAANGVEAIGTDVSNSSNSNSDIFTCSDQSGITAGYLAATYTVAVHALNASDQNIGSAPDLVNKVIASRNQVTDLGTISIPITGL